MLKKGGTCCAQKLTGYHGMFTGFWNEFPKLFFAGMTIDICEPSRFHIWISSFNLVVEDCLPCEELQNVVLGVSIEELPLGKLEGRSQAFLGYIVVV